MIQMTETVADYTTSLDMILQSWHNLRLSSVGVLECWSVRRWKMKTLARKRNGLQNFDPSGYLQNIKNGDF
jgi:hypothetical protein